MAGEGFQLGIQAGRAVANGISQWRQIQLERQQRKEFDGGIALYNQRTLQARQATDPQDGAMLREFELMAKRYPDSKLEERPTNVVSDDGQVESEPVIRTPEGDIPVNQMLQLKARKQQKESLLVMSDIDALMELQARYPNNPLVKQFVASTYSGIQAKQELRYKAQQQQLQQVERLQAQQRIRLDEERLQEERRQFDAVPKRQREQAKLETDEGIRRDTSRILNQKDADIAVEDVRSQTREPRAPTEFDKKVRQMAPRAQQALQRVNELEGSAGSEVYDRTGIGAGVESLTPNALRSGKRQQYEQAQLQFINSVLRAESGATITEAEIDKARDQYFPKVGEAPEVVQQKRQARETAVQELYRAGGLEAPQGGPAQAGAGLSEQELALVEAVKAGKMSKEEARAKRAALRGQ